MNWGLIILFFVIAGISNALMNEIDHRWSRFFGKAVKNEKLKKWMNPRYSWVLKWKYKSRILDIIFSTMLVWVTDFWHLLKLIFLNSFFMMVIIFVVYYYPGYKWWQLLLFFNIAWGVVFEFFFTGLLGLLSDKYK